MTHAPVVNTTKMELTATRPVHLVCGFFYLLLCLQKCLSGKINLDLESYDCAHLRATSVSDTDLVSVIARPRADVLTRADCTIKLEAPNRRRFNIYLYDIYISDCGVKLEFFDRDPHLKIPFKSFGCQSSPGELFSTYGNQLTIRLSKLSSAATKYRIRIELATNQGPKLGTNLDPNCQSKKQFSTLMTLCVALFISWLI